MLTQCPSCQTIFRVTSEILRVAHGQVRCGRCQTQFDALDRLVEENEAGEIQTGRHLRPTPAATGQIEVDEPVTHEDITLEGRHIEISGTYRVMDDAGRSEARIREETTEEWVEIDDIDALPEDVPQEVPEYDLAGQFDAAYDVQDEIQDETRDDDVWADVQDDALEDMRDDLRQDVQDDVLDDIGDDIGDEIRDDEPDEAAQAADNPDESLAPYERPLYQASAHTPAEELDLLPTQPPRAATALVWKILAAPLALLLAVQLVHNYRATLARHPRLGPPLIRLYESLGMTLRPEWNLHAYEILQWRVGSDPTRPGTLRVRASIRNLARFPQPYPLLKLVLEDRWGEQVRAREFEPAEYLDPTTAPDRQLGPAQQANATIEIVDPGPDAEGFRFDVCLRGAAGPVCAADVPEGR